MSRSCTSASLSRSRAARLSCEHAHKRNWVRDDTHQEKQKDHGRRLQVRAESQQTAVAILHHELAAVPWHVAKSPGECYALGGVLGIKRVGIFNGEKLEIGN